MTFLSFFILLMKKYIIIKFFFTINVPINYPPLSKKCAKLSKNCPFASKKIRKIQKNPEKSRKIEIFSHFPYGLNNIFVKSRRIIYRKKNAKKCQEKKLEKK
jgi:hypothetical protein